MSRNDNFKVNLKPQPHEEFQFESQAKINLKPLLRDISRALAINMCIAEVTAARHERNVFQLF